MLKEFTVDISQKEKKKKGEQENLHFFFLFCARTTRVGNDQVKQKE
jgi:hypothetical protein